jgi:ubiquinol-cytochrome c reductase cytochrome b subunit
MLWYFALLALLPPRLEASIIWLFPLLAGLGLIGLPLVFPSGQRHPARRPWAWGFVACALVAIAVLTRIGIRSPWTPDVDARPLPRSVIASGDSTIVRGAMLFHDHACESCHRVSGYGGDYGPDLTYAGDRFSELDITLRIANGAHNMPAFGRYLSAADLGAITAFVKSRTRGHAIARDAR